VKKDGSGKIDELYKTEQRSDKDQTNWYRNENFQPETHLGYGHCSTAFPVRIGRPLFGAILIGEATR